MPVLTEESEEQRCQSAMPIKEISFKGNLVVLRDMDGSEVKLTFDDAIDLYVWLRTHMQELEDKNQAVHFQQSHADDHLHEG